MAELKATVGQIEIASLRNDLRKLGLGGVTAEFHSRDGVAPGTTEILLAFSMALAVEAVKTAFARVYGVLCKHDALIDYNSRMNTLREIVSKEAGGDAKCIFRRDGKKTFTYRFDVHGTVFTCTLDKKGNLTIRKGLK
jgi:hypothetical protein